MAEVCGKSVIASFLSDMGRKVIRRELRAVKVMEEIWVEGQESGRTEALYLEVLRACWRLISPAFICNRQACEESHPKLEDENIPITSINLFDTVLEAVVDIREEKEIRGIKVKKSKVTLTYRWPVCIPRKPKRIIITLKTRSKFGKRCLRVNLTRNE